MALKKIFQKEGRGRPKLSPETKEKQRITQDDFVAISCRLLSMTPREVCDEVNLVSTNCLTALVGTMIIKAIDEADDKRATFILERTVGKVPDKIDILTPPPIVVQCVDPNDMTPEEVSAVQNALKENSDASIATSRD